MYLYEVPAHAIDDALAKRQYTTLYTLLLPVFKQLVLMLRHGHGLAPDWTMTWQGVIEGAKRINVSIPRAWEILNELWYDDDAVLSDISMAFAMAVARCAATDFSDYSAFGIRKFFYREMNMHLARILRKQLTDSRKQLLVEPAQTPEFTEVMPDPMLARAFTLSERAALLAAHHNIPHPPEVHFHATQYEQTLWQKISTLSQTVMT
jgi:hypothetical protein